MTNDPVISVMPVAWLTAATAGIVSEIASYENRI
jgi:hypothetical protein